MEHRLIYVFLALILISGCNKPINPIPESSSDIYQDLRKQESELKGYIEIQEKEVSDREAEHKKALPQTGLSKATKDRLFESKNKLQKLKQEMLYLSLSIKTKKASLRSDYIKSFNKNTPWEPNKNSKEYFDNKKLRENKTNWSRRAAEAEEAAKNQRPAPPQP